MASNYKYELIIEQANEIAKAMKNMYDIVGISPRETEQLVKNAPSFVAAYLSEDEANSKKEELEADESAVYSINQTDLTYKVIIVDFDFDRDTSKTTKLYTALKDTLGLGLSEVMEIIRKDPIIVAKNLSLDEAEDLKSNLLNLLEDVCQIINVEPEL